MAAATVSASSPPTPPPSKLRWWESEQSQMDNGGAKKGWNVLSTFFMTLTQTHRHTKRRGRASWRWLEYHSINVYRNLIATLCDATKWCDIYKQLQPAFSLFAILSTWSSDNTTARVWLHFITLLTAVACRFYVRVRAFHVQASNRHSPHSAPPKRN